jgi:hypothetical protein
MYEALALECGQRETTAGQLPGDPASLTPSRSLPEEGQGGGGAVG